MDYLPIGFLLDGSKPTFGTAIRCCPVVTLS
jgi:hypothetical protein